MSWLNLNQSLNSLKGQITNFATEVLSEGAVQDSSESSSRTDVSSKELEEKCRNQELEIAALKKLNHELEASLQSERLSRKNGVKDEDSNWYWDPPPQQPSPEPEGSQFEAQIRAQQEEISTLKAKLKDQNASPGLNAELERLKEENRNLTSNLEDLDNQHQLAMERLLALKKELQKNFEVLKQEHEDLKLSNDEFVNEKQTLLNKIGERDKEIEKLKTEKAEYETLHHKYLTLEKVHSMLKENLEKFQEENQDLHEEVFKLQEQVTKYEHELEMSVKNSELSNMVPRDNYEQLLKELNDLKETKNCNRDQLEDTNIDDNAKSVIEGLKREIRELKHSLAQKENDEIHKVQDNIKPEKVMHLYNKYVNFDLPVDYIGEMPSSDDNIVLFKLESVFKTLNSFKKDINALEHQLSEKNHNINHMQTQIEDMTAENDFLTTDLQQFERELNEMKKNNDFLINEIAALKNTSKLEPILETHEDNVAKLETELDTCHKINKTFESEIARIEKELSEVKAEKISLQENLNDLKKKYESVLNDFETVKAETTALEELEVSSRNQDSDKLKVATDEIDELKKKLNSSVAKNEQLAIDIHIIENDKVLLTKQVDDLKHALLESTSSHKELEKLKYALDNKFEDVKEKLDEVIKNKNDLESQKIQLSENLESEISRNNSLQAELERISTEKTNLLQKLEQSLHKNVSLQESIEKLSTEIAVLKQNEGEINNSSRRSSQMECPDNSTLLDNINELKAKILNQEELNTEISDLKLERQVLIEKKLTLEAELASTDNKIARLEQDFDRIISELNEKDSLLDSMNATIQDNSITIENLNVAVTDLNKTLEIKNEEIQRLSASLNSISTKSGRSFEELMKLNNEKEDLQQQIMNLHETVQSRNNHISTLSQQHEELNTQCNDLKAKIDSKDKEIKELNQSIVELTDKMKTAESYSHLNDEYAQLVHEKETIEKEATDLKNYVLTKDIELSELKQRLESVEKSCLEYKTALEIASKEKAELINLINLKHNESIQYHNEIQRLNQVILEQTNEFKRVIEEKDLLLSNNSGSCQNCENLRMTLKEKDEIILMLNQNTSECEKLKAELSQAKDTVRSLQERSENLDKSMAIQLEAVKKLTAENVQLSEQEQNSTKELERLRRHLVELEENYTQELMTSEQKLTECQSRLHLVEERAKQTSTVYTSNSIRANQEVETLRNQIKLLEKQREEVQARLSEAEDARSRSEAALTNLQVVLEQFQLDKERDIELATEKIRNKMEDVKRQNLGLQDEISRLNTKLEEALAGLQAAARLGDQVETKTAQINDLKEQVRTLQVSVAAAEERYYNATSNQQDKVDKNLVKNLVINYVMTAAHNSTNKVQVLRILSTVLDFNQQECEKLGLVRSSAAPDSLAAEFVKFLQNESKPRGPMPNMMGLTQSSSSRSTTPSSRKNSTLGPNPIMETGHKRNTSSGSNNLLFQNLDALETSSQISIDSDTTRRSDSANLLRPLDIVGRSLESGVTQPRDTEGAILKHVLRDM